jgi:prepilin-type N-terminal cleavage/methylation domain-containing protein
MKKTGFTLIELLIVITIIAILAGAAIPYVQQYVDDARYAKVKQDLDEISKALMRYENDQNKPYDVTDIAKLVGPYLTKTLVDPWGSLYRVAPASSTCYTLGPDSTDSTGDEIKLAFRPPLALSRAFWEDSNNNSNVDTGDVLILRFTRPVAPAGGPVLADLAYSAGAPANAYSAKVLADNDMTVRLPLDVGASSPFRPGKDMIRVVSPNTIVDGDGVQCKAGQETVIKARN